MIEIILNMLLKIIDKIPFTRIFSSPFDVRFVKGYSVNKPIVCIYVTNINKLPIPIYDIYLLRGRKKVKLNTWKAYLIEGGKSNSFHISKNDVEKCSTKGKVSICLIYSDNRKQKYRISKYHISHLLDKVNN